MIAAHVTEADFQRAVMDLAHWHRWRVVHVRNVAVLQRGHTVYQVPYEGAPGLPDLVMARGGRVLLAELKTDRGRVTPDQQAWLDAAGEHGRLWRPADWQTIQNELGRKVGDGDG